MQSGAQSSEKRISDRAQAAALEHPLRARLLMACVADERSLSDLQRLSGQTLPKLHYHVSRLLDSGLMRVSRQQARGGRPIRWFRAVAERFLVPQEFLDDLPGEALAAELRNALQMSRGEVSLRYAADPQGNPIALLVRDEAARPPKSIELWRILKLSRGQRDALAGELAELFARYARAEAEPGGETFLIHAAFAPRL
jgi:DNA-binding transcriptional ArsR family regulator